MAPKAPNPSAIPAGMPRPEYPRPQFTRTDWLCLNGEWEFEVDAGDSGLARGLNSRSLAQRITVPFCPESVLSGIGNTDFMPAVWYRRTVEVPKGWKGRVQLHFQAVDHDTTVWADGVEVGRHRGGFTPFSCDLGGIATPGRPVTIVVRARDDNRPVQARGKQSQRYGNHDCMYVRTTGIWQTVWLEPVPESHLLRPRITPDLDQGLITIDQAVAAPRTGLSVRATLRDAKGPVVTVSAAVGNGLAPRLVLPIPSARRRPWSPQDPHLYDIDLELVDGSGAVVDRAGSYAGLRSVGIDGKAVTINHRRVFQRLVLDQGYYPDGILTAPSDAALRADIELSMAVGFNGARLHQKVFEERFLYHADRMGYLVWGEFPDWGCAGKGVGDDHQQPTSSYITQWLEAVLRDYSHPAIIGWCPLNETAQNITDNICVLDDVTRAMFLATKAIDTTRPVLDASGYSHRVPESDIYDCHDYEQDPAKFRTNQAGLATGKPFVNNDVRWSIPYRGQPYFVSEFGGIWWNPDLKPGEASWGYGQKPKTLEEFHERFAGLCGVLLDDPDMFGYCYTQLTDVFQEQNGIFTFDRRAKFDAKRLHQVQSRVAAIEKAAGAVAAGRHA